MAQTAAPRGGQAVPVYKRASLSVEERVADLLARMTPEEKIAELRRGMQALNRPVEEIDAQQRAVLNARLGIPILFYDDGTPPGSTGERTAAQSAARAGPAGQSAIAAYPAAIAIAASWDPALAEEAGDFAAQELRARGGRMAFQPVLDVVRDPRYGRIERTFGEDAYLAGELGVAAVTGWQGAASAPALPPGKALAAVGHFAGHGMTNSGAGALPTAQRELREVFFPPYETVIKRAAPAAVVIARNDLDAVPSHANKWLLRGVLRGEWGFRGAVLSDRGGVGELQTVHGVAGSAAHAARLALDAGIDIDLPAGNADVALGAAAPAGSPGPTTQSAKVNLDAAVGRMLALKFRAGLFEQPFTDTDGQGKTRDLAQSESAALKAAQRSIVLLKNDGKLPFAVQGADTRPRVLVVENGGPSSTSASVAEGLRARARDRIAVIAISPLAAVMNSQAVNVGIEIIAAKMDIGKASVDAMKAHAQNAKAVIDPFRSAAPDHVVLVIDGSAQSGNDALLQSLLALGKPVTVVLTADRPHLDAKVAAQAGALVGAWSLGAQGGKAIADVLLGDINPGGKLPMTLARSAGQLPITYDAKPSARRGYLFDSSEPLFAFGWGLGYSTFELSAPRLSRASVPAPVPLPKGNSSNKAAIGGRNTGAAANELDAASITVEVAVDIRNTGTRPGDETVQLYVRDKVSSVTRPVKELRGFQRVTLAPGERRTLTFALTTRSFEMWDENLKRVVEPGEFDILTGANSTQTQSVTLTVTGRTLP